MLVYVAEERQAECNHPFRRVGDGRPISRQDVKEQRTHTARQQVVLVPEVNVEGRAADSGAGEDLRDGDAVVRLLADEGAEGFVEERARPPNPPILGLLAGQSCRHCPISHDSVFPFFAAIGREPTLRIEQMSIFEGRSKW